jgi:hypothetical protein
VKFHFPYCSPKLKNEPEYLFKMERFSITIKPIPNINKPRRRETSID